MARLDGPLLGVLRGAHELGGEEQHDAVHAHGNPARGKGGGEAGSTSDERRRGRGATRPHSGFLRGQVVHTVLNRRGGRAGTRLFHPCPPSVCCNPKPSLLLSEDSACSTAHHIARVCMRSCCQRQARCSPANRHDAAAVALIGIVEVVGQRAAQRCTGRRGGGDKARPTTAQHPVTAIQRSVASSNGNSSSMHAALSAGGSVRARRAFVSVAPRHGSTAPPPTGTWREGVRWPPLASAPGRHGQDHCAA